MTHFDSIYIFVKERLNPWDIHITLKFGGWPMAELQIHCTVCLYADGLRFKFQLSNVRKLTVTGRWFNDLNLVSQDFRHNIKQNSSFFIMAHSANDYFKLQFYIK